MRDYNWFAPALCLILLPNLASCARQTPAPKLASRPTVARAVAPAPAPTKNPLILSPFDGAPPPPAVVSLNQSLLDSAATDDIAGIQAALARGADINVLEDQSKDHTPLTYAAENGYADATRFLLRRGANPDGVTWRIGPQASPLFWTVSNNQIECARLLLRAGADPNRLSFDNLRIVETAAYDGNIAITEMLIGRMPKLDSFDRNKLRKQANNVWLCRVCSVGSLQQVRAALAAGGDPNYLDAGNDVGTGSPLMRATERADLPIMKLLLQHGAKVNLRDSDGSTALMKLGIDDYWRRVEPRAAARKEAETEASTRLLLRAGAEVNLRDLNGATALMNAAQGNAAATAMLLAHGADVGARDEQKRAALHWAASVRDDRSLQVLLRHGARLDARLDARDGDGATALMLASVQADAPVSARESAARLRCLRLLKSAGADAKIKDNRGHSAADYREMRDGDFVNGG